MFVGYSYQVIEFFCHIPFMVIAIATQGEIAEKEFIMNKFQYRKR